MRHRIFIAINLPERVKNKLAQYQEKWPELPAKWTKKENLHITLMFLGYLSDEDLLEALKKIKNSFAEQNDFSIVLKKITYGPTDKKPFPEKENHSGKTGKKPARMIWAIGQDSKELGRLQKDLEESLFLKTGSFREKRSFAPHITLARIRQWEFKKMEEEERPQINEEISLDFEVSSIEVMESQLKRGGPEYTILESIPLSKNGQLT